MKPLLEVERLVVEAGGAVPVRILDGIDLRIAAGEVVAAIGASGSGKSTLGLALAGYARPGTRIASGRIRFDDHDVLALPARELRLLRGRDIAFVPQSAAAAFNPALTIGAQVVEAAVLRGEASRAEGSRLAHRLFAGFGLPDPQSIGRRYPHQVSGGQLQRAAAAMAFAGNPKLIVFDEPTTSLDVTTQVGVLAAFRERIRSCKTAALYISHDIAVAAELADRIVVLEHGRIVDQGGARELVSRHGARRRGALTRVLPDAEPLLAVDRLTVGYGQSATPALSEVSFDIRHGETVGVIGESGSGKSTLARALIGLLQSRTGAITFAGQSLPALVRHRSLRTRKALQIAFQSADVALNPRQRAGDILGRPLTTFRGLRGAERDREVSRLLAL
ncbi:MAG: ABC transporter ATP-binding protein, partial [Reyranella sp.]